MEFQEGDTVLLTGPNDYTYTTKVRNYESYGLVVDIFPEDGWWQTIDNLVHVGITVTVIDRPLPTKSGLYKDKDGDIWKFEDGEWRMANFYDNDQVKTSYGPFKFIGELE